MLQADYRGARGSNAGDDFHELWALRQALALLDQDTELTAVAVEGLRAEDESGTPQDTWDGVDCTLYFGGDHVPSARRIVIAQLKYSAANPDHTWTVARLTHASNKKNDNSVVGRLANAFAGLKEKRPDLVTSGNLIVRLVSNQRVDPAVINALSGQRTAERVSNGHSGHQPDRAALLAASGLEEKDFDTFATALDLSECERGSRFAIEESVLATIANWTDDDARAAVDHLMRYVRRAMLPETKGESITRQSILLQMGFSDPRALFPCSPALKRIDRLIPREASQILAKRMTSGDQRICLHGEGGCGKTTALQEIETLLPYGSVMIVFDCYGSGRYLDSDAYRHRPADAFLQLCNDLARQLRIPLLVSRSMNLDYPKVFKRRLEKAAEVVASRADDALLLIAVDAADNSITAASTRSPPERGFVHDFVALGDLPRNVRLVVTGRTGQLPALELPRGFTPLELKGFGRDETAAHVRGSWDNAPDAWIEDFNHLSGGNPRVQQYALEYAGAEPARALDYLRPDGKGLDQIFRDQLKYALRKEGYDQDIKVFCAGLIALPRPVPVADLSKVTDLSEAHIRDICSDLAPGVRLTNELIGFGDVEFEHFVRTEAETQLGRIQARIANHFVSRHRSDAYAAAHVAAALLVAGCGRQIIELINTEREPVAITDPVIRRETQLQRFRIAMKVCREAGNNVDAILTLLIGAEALKTDAAIHRMLIENPDLAAHFARDTAAREILRDPDEVENHGPLLFHLMAADARDGDGISVREEYRQLRAWIRRRAEHREEQSKNYPDSQPQSWSIHVCDIAAETEAVLRIAGPQAAVESLMGWRPRSLAIHVAIILGSKLITSGESSIIERCLTEGRILAPWDLFLLTQLAISGKEVDLSRLESGLAKLLRRGLIRLDGLVEAWRDDEDTAEYLDLILTACEAVVARGGDRAHVVPVLQRFAEPEFRRRDKLFTSRATVIDFTLRAQALIERLAGRKMSLQTYLVDPPEPLRDLPPKRVEQIKRSDNEKNEELNDFIGPLVDIYDLRAQAFLGSILVEAVGTQLQAAISHYHNQEYRIRRQYDAPAMRTRAALSITRLMVLPGLDRKVILQCATSLLGSRSDPFGSPETQIFGSLALDQSLHKEILDAVTARSKSVRSLKASAEEKLKALIRLARLLLPFSFRDAEHFFNQAIEIAGEVDSEAVHEIALFAPLAERAVDSMQADERRAVARDLAIVMSDAGVRLAGYDYFPWEAGARALATLDVCLALAATARWEDSGVVDRSTLLPTLFETALSRHDLSPVQVSALSPLLDDFNVNLIGRIVEEVHRLRGDFDPKPLAEHLAREELLRFGRGLRPQACKKLKSLPMGDGAAFWMDCLTRAMTFHQAVRPTPDSSTSKPEPEARYIGEKIERSDPLDSINWTAYRFVSPGEIDDVIGRALAASRESKAIVWVSMILDRIATATALGDRVAHLEALSRIESPRVADYEIAQAIARRVDDWHEAPSVDRWCREQLIQVVVDLLPGFSRWLANGESLLPALLEKIDIPDYQTCAKLLEGMERHVDALDASTVYALIGLVGQYCKHDDAAQVIARYAERLVQRVPGKERDVWDLADIPTEVTEGMARLLYALMGDVDVRTRWRAAHALRCLARLGDIGTVDHIVGLYSRTSEPCYRTPDAPFYWLAARLWLTMALDRIADEMPLATEGHGLWLLEIASDDKFPHILVRSFAKSAVCKLVESGTLVLNQQQREALKRANTSTVRKKKSRKPYYRVGFDRYHYRQREERRFHFDTLDTLPYWYSRALRCFADLDQENFLDAAEQWIVDRWEVRNNPWQWDQEPRQRRLSDDSVSSRHSHGSLPTMERYHTYLEWHAMWCATGELMQTRPLLKAREDEYDTLERWLSGEGLTMPPLWLADLHGPKPLEDQLWCSPQGDVDAWVEHVGDNDFLAELGLVSDDGSIVVEGHHDTRSHEFRSSVRVHSALVSPETARALVRALQTVNDSWDYRIPPAGDDLEINVPPYKLVGWLVDSRHDLGIDEGDRFRHEIRGIECRPSSKTVKALNLEFVYEDQVKWSQGSRQKAVFVYQAWGDSRGDEGDRFRYDKTVRSGGWRLSRLRKNSFFLTSSLTNMILSPQSSYTED